MNSAIRSRVAGERHTQLTLIRLLCAVSIWRTATTRLLPLCGASAWWVTLLCLLPGFGVAALLRWTMHLTRSTTFAEAVRACLGKFGAYVAAAVLFLLLAMEGVSGMTSLITLFTQGIGTRGTQLTLAVLTGLILLMCLHREGLSRAAHFLRWGIAAAWVPVVACLLADARLDHIFPLYGEGESTILAAVRAGWSLAWPITLLLTVEPPQPDIRLQCGIVPAFCAAGALLLLSLSIPRESLTGNAALADSLLLAVRYVPNAVRVVGQSLMMLTFFLGVGAAAQLAADAVCLPARRQPDWLPYVLAALLIASQALEISRMWALLESIATWLLAPLLLLALVCLPIAWIRRKSG